MDFGEGIKVAGFRIIDDGNIEAKIEISEDANSGSRDVKLHGSSGVGILSNGFSVN